MIKHSGGGQPGRMASRNYDKTKHQKKKARSAEGGPSTESGLKG